jgi:hypothetical protein
MLRGEVLGRRGSSVRAVSDMNVIVKHGEARSESLGLLPFPFDSNFLLKPRNQAGQGGREGCIARLNCVSPRALCDGQLVLVLIPGLGRPESPGRLVEEVGFFHDLLHLRSFTHCECRSFYLYRRRDIGKPTRAFKTNTHRPTPLDMGHELTL